MFFLKQFWSVVLVMNKLHLSAHVRGISFTSNLGVVLSIGRQKKALIFCSVAITAESSSLAQNGFIIATHLIGCISRAEDGDGTATQCFNTATA